GSASAYNLHQIPNSTNSGNLVISAHSDVWHGGNGQSDLLLFEIDLDFNAATLIKWSYNKGESTSDGNHAWDGQDFIIDNVTSSGYDVTIVGKSFKQVYSNGVAKVNSDNSHTFAAGDLQIEQSKVLL